MNILNSVLSAILSYGALPMASLVIVSGGISYHLISSSVRQHVVDLMSSTIALAFFALAVTYLDRKLHYVIILGALIAIGIAISKFWNWDGKKEEQ